MHSLLKSAKTVVDETVKDRDKVNSKAYSMKHPPDNTMTKMIEH